MIISYKKHLPLLASLFALYFIWGSTYFAILIGLESFPPAMLTGIRFFFAGIILLMFLLISGEKLPDLTATLNAVFVGLLLLAVGNGSVTLAEHVHVPSGITAVMVATIPLFTLCISALYGTKTARIEWAGVAIGLIGIILLNMNGHLGNNSWGTLIILCGAISWAFGSNWGARKKLPKGMMAGAIEMLAAGLVLLIISVFSGEKIMSLPSVRSLVAMGYLIFFGSIITITAYMYLIRSTSPVVATSYAYVNPLVAVFIGTRIGSETLTPQEWVGLAVIVFSVLLVTVGKYFCTTKYEVTS